MLAFAAPAPAEVAAPVDLPTAMDRVAIKTKEITTADMLSASFPSKRMKNSFFLRAQQGCSNKTEKEPAGRLFPQLHVRRLFQSFIQILKISDVFPCFAVADDVQATLSPCNGNIKQIGLLACPGAGAIRLAIVTRSA